MSRTESLSIKQTHCSKETKAESAENRPHFRWIVTIASFFAVLLSWSLTTPVGGYPDDSFHFSNIWCDEGIAEFKCESVDNGQKRLVPNVFTDGSPWWEPTGQATVWRYPEDVYPRVFYLAMRVVITDDVVSSVFRMRLLNSLISFAVLLLAAMACPIRLRNALFVSWLVAGAGLAFFYIASNHPLSWLIVGGGTLWVFFAALGEPMKPISRVRAVLGFIASTILVLGARPEGQAVFVLSMVVGVGALLTKQRAQKLRSKWNLQTLKWKLLMSTVVAFVLGGAAALGFKFLSRTSEVSLSTIQRKTGGEIFNQVVDLPLLILYAVGSNARNTEQGVLGPQSVVLFTAFSGVVLLGLTRWWIGKIAAVFAAAGVLVLAPFGMVSDLRVLSTPPRYLITFLVLFLVALLLRDNCKISSGELCLFRAIYGVLVVGHSLSLHSAIRPYQVGQPPDWTLDLNGGLKWWWSIGLSPQSVWLLGSASFLVMAASISRVVFMEKSQDR